MLNTDISGRPQLLDSTGGPADDVIGKNCGISITSSSATEVDTAEDLVADSCGV